MLVTEFLEFGDLWRALPLKNAADQRIFAWHKRCARRGVGGAGLLQRLCRRPAAARPCPWHHPLQWPARGV